MPTCAIPEGVAAAFCMKWCLGGVPIGRLPLGGGDPSIGDVVLRGGALLVRSRSSSSSVNTFSFFTETAFTMAASWKRAFNIIYQNITTHLLYK